MLNKDYASLEKASQFAGYVFSYFLFTTILFFVLHFLQKIPASWTYLHIVIITLGIIAFGESLKRYLTC